MTTSLLPVDPLSALHEASAHLGAGLMQVRPTDDQIVIEHMRTAHEIIKLVIDAQRAAADVARIQKVA